MRSKLWVTTMILFWNHSPLCFTSTNPPIYQVLLLHTEPWVHYWERWVLMCVYVCMCVYIHVHVCVQVCVYVWVCSVNHQVQLFATCSSVYGISQARLLEWVAIPFYTSYAGSLWLSKNHPHLISTYSSPSPLHPHAPHRGTEGL